MGLYSDVTVTINFEKVVGKLEFGIPLIIKGMAPAAIAYQEYTKTSAVSAAFGEEDVVTRLAKTIFDQENPPKRIACIAVTTSVLDALDGISQRGWRQLLVASEGVEGESSMEDIATWCDENAKMYFTKIAHLSDFTPNNTIHWDHTVCVVSGENSVNAAAALVGATAGKEVGSFTYKNQILFGVTPEPISEDTLEDIHDANMQTVLRKAGDIVSSEGKTLAGSYIDNIDSRDWLIQQIQYYVQKALNNAEKLPYDQTGINVLESVVIGVLNTAYRNGMIAVDAEGVPSYWTDFALREETEQSDRAERRYIGGDFGFIIAGAIHDVGITGHIEI